MREALRQHKQVKRKPDGDFIKLLITHKGWNATQIRSIIREPAVCELHPNPTEAERLWVCERNVPPIGSWLLNYSALEDEELEEAKKEELEKWDRAEGDKDAKDQAPQTQCPCFSMVHNPSAEDVWKGHICTSNVRKFKSPLIRALLHKGHAYKVEQSEESLLRELVLGLDGYIAFKCRHKGDSMDYLRWKEAILWRVQEKLRNKETTLYPQGEIGHKEVRRLQEHLVFLKEDRAPHVVVGMCKYRYMLERERYLTTGPTFLPCYEREEDVLERHRDFHLNKGLAAHNRLPYIYGIWKSVKRNLRWISGVKKRGPEDKEEGKPKGSIAGSGEELVGLLQQVMRSLKRKDDEGRKLGKPKRCWFIESVEEIAQPLRFEADKVARAQDTALSVDFVAMYPNFHQGRLKERLRDALEEAWSWEESMMQMEEGAERRTLKLKKDGWVELTAADLKKPSLGLWFKEEVLELLHFVIENGFVKRGSKIYRQVKGFGMGLACAVQMADLGLYPVERNFAEGRRAEEVEHNYRYVDDIFSLLACIPSQEEYGMEYKVGSKGMEGTIPFVGMELMWEKTRKGTNFKTGMYFRDNNYPIRIRRYPANGSMVTDSQRIGVSTSQFIRAQRLCSVLPTFKAGVYQVVLAALRRGYKRGELDRVWGKFLVNWWKAEEVRRGEMRAWFRRMTAWAAKQVKEESNQVDRATANSKKGCVHAAKCWYKAAFCPFAHLEAPLERPQQTLAHHSALKLANPKVSSKEQIPKPLAQVWRACGDGACLFHSILQSNDPKQANELRIKLVDYAGKEGDTMILGLGITVRQMLEADGKSMANYLNELAKPTFWGGEPELVLLSQMLRLRIRVFKDAGDHWEEEREYGVAGSLCRLHYNGAHYNRIMAKEAWEKFAAQLAAEEAACISAKEGWIGLGKGGLVQPRSSVKCLTMQGEGQKVSWQKQCENKALAERKARRAELLQISRMEDEEVLAILAEMRQQNLDATEAAIYRILTSKSPWDALGVREDALKGEGMKAYHALSVLVHPDKCLHPRATQASQKLQEVVKWFTNREEFYLERATRRAQLCHCARQTAKVKRWQRAGGHLRFAECEEMSHRLYHAVDECREWTTLEALWTLEACWLLHMEGSREQMAEDAQGGEMNVTLEQTRASQGTRTYCVCKKSHTGRHYMIQCVVCGEWYHPACLGQTKTQCEKARQTSGWRCNLAGCNQGSS